MKRVVSFLFGIIILLVLAVLLIVGYLGLVPGLSKIMGSDKPRDLGVRFSEADKTSGRTKSQIIYDTLPENTPAAQSIQRFGKREVNTEFTSSEITALMNNRPWKYWPYTDVQVKFSADGSAEVSGILLKNKLSGYGAAIDAPQEAVDFAQKFLPANPAFYVKGRASLTDNKVSVFEPESFEVGRMPLPVSMFLSYLPNILNVGEVLAAESNDMVSQLSKIKNKRELIINYINSRLSQINGFYAKEAKFGDNQLIFSGTLPEREATVR